MTDKLWKTAMAVIIILEIIAFLFIVTHAHPRAIAKFCVNQVVENADLSKISAQAQRHGCYQLTVTPLDETRSHVYSVVVYVGE